MKTVNKSNEIAMLQYRAQRYKAAGNGTMCQFLNSKIQKLMGKL